MNIPVYDYTLILLMGASGAGKTTFARKHFFDYEINESDRPDLTRTLQVMDGNWLDQEKRREVLKDAKKENYLRIGIVFDLDEEALFAHGRKPSPDLRSQRQQASSLKKRLREEGFDQLYFLNSDEETNSVTIERRKPVFDLKNETGPFDIIGDVHGCLAELEKLIRKLGYQEKEGIYSHKDNRKLIFVGDIVDRGPDSLGVIRLIMKLCSQNIAFMVQGNHDDRLLRYLKGNAVEVKHGLETTAEEFRNVSDGEKQEIIRFLENTPTYYVFDNGNLLAVHAGIKESYVGKYTKRIREFCLFGLTTGEINEIGMPVRLDWARDYKGDTLIVYGHTPGLYVYRQNNAICVDTGCVFMNRLSALRYPEMTVVDVRKKK